MPLKWSDVEEISQLLYESDPELDPRSVRFTDLQDRVLALPEFQDEPGRFHEKVLAAIHTARACWSPGS